MKVLIIGGGGREHALGWKLAQSPKTTELFFAPGNPGTADLGRNVQLTGSDQFVDFAREHQIDLVVVGPEQPLVNGLVDEMAEAGIPCFGPSKAVAQLEGSKAFAKQVMAEIGLPTASYAAFDDYQQALAHLNQVGAPIVVKANGLAGGKGVTVCQNLAEAQAALSEAMVDGRFGAAGSTVVLEELLIGTEASYHVICDGERMLALPTAQDHKALLDGNAGPNTGGMGTCSPNPVLTESMCREIEETIARPLFQYFNDQGTPFRGVLFIGLMLTWHGPKVLEFNVRFGDPETQVMLPRIKSDLLPVLYQAATGQLDETALEIDDRVSLCVVLTAAGYPSSPAKGDPISEFPEGRDDLVVFHAGTALRDDGRVVTAGGRVLGVTAWGDQLEQARKRAYKAANQIQFKGKHFRKDIGVTS